MRFATFLTAVAIAGCAHPICADVIQYKSEDGDVEQVLGNVLTRFQDGMLWVETQDLQHHFIRKQDQIKWTKTGAKLRPYSSQQLRAKLRSEFGARFNTVTRKHYLLIYNCSSEYAEQAGKLLEQVHDYFVNYFRNKGGFRFTGLKQPLVAVVFESRNEYLAHVSPLTSSSLAWTGGVYMQRTNRFYTYQVGPTTEADPKTGRRYSQQYLDAVNRRNIEVIVHEGIHQLAYNLGFHSRLSHNPTWLTEGMAMYFETSDLSSRSGWNGAGIVNQRRLGEFAKTFDGLRSNVIRSLVESDKAFQDPGQVGEAYANAWALTYYLLRSRPRAYMRYLRSINSRELKPYTQKERLSDFKAAFGKSPEGLELDFRRFMSSLVAAAKSK